MKDRLHQRMKLSELYRHRGEYQIFPAKIFKEHVYQEIWRDKFIAYLSWKRQTGNSKIFSSLLDGMQSLTVGQAGQEDRKAKLEQYLAEQIQAKAKEAKRKTPATTETPKEGKQPQQGSNSKIQKVN